MGSQTPPDAPPAAEVSLLAERERTKLLGYARSRFGISTEDAEDLLQDALLELLKRRAQVLKPDAYLFTVFRLSCVRFVVSGRAGRETLEAAAEIAEELSAPERIHGRVLLHQALAEISSTCRRILCAFYVEGRSLRETAETLAVAETGVTKTINRCLRRLRACLS
jgi:RNA polymerase sigma factor (sigma-70 family)